MQEVRLTSRRAAVAASLLLTMLQLQHSGHRPSLNQAIPLVTALLPEWQQPQSPYWSEICHFEHRPRSKTTMLQAYNQFRTVAHFWGALLHGQEHDRQDIWPGSPQTLPTFLSYAEGLADADRAVTLNPQEASFFHTRAWTYFKKGLLDLALADFDKALSLDAELAGAYADRGRAYELKGERDKAIADYRKALSLKSRQTYDDKAKAETSQHLTALGVVNPGGGVEKVTRQPEP